MSNRRKLRSPGRYQVALRESATSTVERREGVQITEATTARLTPAEGGALRYRTRIIEGDRQGSSGYYDAAVLREAAAKRVFGAGLQMYADHPSRTEEADRPERSIKDLAGHLVTDAMYEGDGLYATIEVFPHWAPVIEALKDDIGVSIRATGTAEYGKPEGKPGPLITELTEAYSVDFVTKAGAGGAIVSLVESARQSGVPVPLREATANEVRSALSDALDDAFEDPDDDNDIDCWVSVLDYDPDKNLVWYVTRDYGGGDACMWEQGYTVTTTGDVPVVALADSRTPVVARTIYVPAPTDDGYGSDGTAMSEAVLQATPWPLREAISDDVKSKFVSDLKTRDTPVRIAAGMRRLSQWAASGHYPTGTTYEDLKWFYDQCAAELKRRDPKSSAGGNFPAAKSGA